MTAKKAPTPTPDDEIRPGIKKVKECERNSLYHTQADREIRGMILYCATVIERSLHMINNLFFDRKLRKHEFTKPLLHDHLETGYARTEALFKLILSKYYPDIKDVYPDLFNELKCIRETRNVVAHEPSNASPDDDRIVFTHFIDRINSDSISIDTAAEYNFLCGKVHSQLLEIGIQIQERIPVEKGDE
jgi:hypothetical protein